MSGDGKTVFQWLLPDTIVIYVYRSYSSGLKQLGAPVVATLPHKHSLIAKGTDIMHTVHTPVAADASYLNP